MEQREWINNQIANAETEQRELWKQIHPIKAQRDKAGLKSDEGMKLDEQFKILSKQARTLTLRLKLLREKLKQVK